MDNVLKYATVRWTVEDIVDFAEQRGKKMTQAQAHEFLEKNQRHIQDRLVEYGWEVIEALMDYEDAE